MVSALREFDIETLRLVICPFRIREAKPVRDVVQISGLCQSFRMTREFDCCNGSASCLGARSCVCTNPLLDFNLDRPGHLEPVRGLCLVASYRPGSPTC